MHSRHPTAGSIAAAKIPAESCSQRHVLPPLSGGLHCGARTALPTREACLVPPPFTTGSIAARTRRRPRPPGPPLLPPSMAGPIAAIGSLRQRTRLADVLPPFSGGLHRGRKPWGSPTPVPVSAPAVQTAGSIAACGTTTSPPHLSSYAPALQRRAPLRLLVVDQALERELHAAAVRRRASLGESEDHTERWVYRVLLPFNGGLHCGCVMSKISAGMTSTCSRRCTGGLHCGNQVSSGVTASCSSVLPPPNGRLHCG